MGIINRIVTALVGVSEPMPVEMWTRYPELASVRIRRGGLAPRVGGWALGRATVAAITLRPWVFLAPGVPTDAPLLLHELRHLQQFEASPLFPIQYVWASLRHGYHANPYEVDARDFAARRVRASGTVSAGEHHRGV